MIFVVGGHSGGELEVEGLAPAKLDFEGVLVDGRVRHRSLPFRGERYSVVAFTHECRLNLTPKAMAESRALGYQPTSGEFLEAWSLNFPRKTHNEPSSTKGRRKDTPNAAEQGGLSRWRSVDGICTRETCKVMDGQSASMAESAACRLAAVPATVVRRTKSSKVADGQSASAAKSGASRSAALPASANDEAPSVVRHVLH